MPQNLIPAGRARLLPALAALAAAFLAVVLLAGPAPAQDGAQPAPPAQDSSGIVETDLSPGAAPEPTASLPPAQVPALPPGSDASAVVNPDPASAPVRMPPLKVAKPPPFPGASLTPDGMTLIRFFGAFVAVVAVLLICLKIIAWLGRGRRPAKGGRAFTLRGTMALDGRRYLAAVEVDGHLVVVGVTPERLTGLAHWALEDDLFDGPSIGGPLPDPPAPKKPPRPAAAAGPTLEKTAGFPTVFPEAGAAGPPPKEPPTGSGRDAPDFTLALDETPYEGQQTNDDLRKLDLGDD